MSKARFAALLLMAVATLLLLLLLFLWAGRGEQQGTAALPPPPTAEPRPTIVSRDAYEQALQTAREWQPDAQLVKVSAAWSETSVEELLDGRPGWTFQFYSPAAGETQDISVAQETAMPVRRRTVPSPPRIISEETWRISGEDAVIFFLANGGDSYLNRTDRAAVHMHLSTDSSGRLVWTIIAAPQGGGEPFVVQVDGTTGQVIP